MQFLIVALVVAGCFGYAAWTLMPSPARRWMARHMATWPLPARVLAKLRRQAESSGGCSCDGCDKSAHAKTKTAARPPVAPVTFHPRRRP
ncbi:MAG TPA: hypothetical protein VFF72_06275 [Caldimonas sp.]|nr:hypothetical protein [Caldimonas sp.]